MLFATNFKTIKGIALDCTYGMAEFAQVGSVYACTARVLFDGIVTENVTAVFGIHQTGKGHEDVHGLYGELQNLDFVPGNIESFFSNIIAINLRHNSITAVFNRHLSPFPNLQHLSLWNNTITSIDGDLFSGLNSLRYISFDNNYIRHVGHDLNLPVGSGSIRFSANVCISQSANTPDDAASLKLNLLRNCPPTISQIEDSLERRQNFLTHIDRQVQSLVDRVAYLEAIIGNLFEASTADQLSIDQSDKKYN